MKLLLEYQALLHPPLLHRSVRGQRRLPCDCCSALWPPFVHEILLVFVIIKISPPPFVRVRVGDAGPFPCLFLLPFFSVIYFYPAADNLRFSFLL